MLRHMPELILGCIRVHAIAVSVPLRGVTLFGLRASICSERLRVKVAIWRAVSDTCSVHMSPALPFLKRDRETAEVHIELAWLLTMKTACYYLCYNMVVSLGLYTHQPILVSPMVATTVVCCARVWTEDVQFAISRISGSSRGPLLHCTSPAWYTKTCVCGIYMWGFVVHIYMCLWYYVFEKKAYIMSIIQCIVSSLLLWYYVHDRSHCGTHKYNVFVVLCTWDKSLFMKSITQMHRVLNTVCGIMSEAIAIGSGLPSDIIIRSQVAQTRRNWARHTYRYCWYCRCCCYSYC